jgi:protoporphyrinogen/coproporphyrinogen III oxidase
MNPTSNKPVVILGAGLAGLTAANYLRRQNIPVILYEAGSKIAGLARSFHDDEGFTYDFGAHFVTNRLAETIGVADKCRTVKHYAETVWLGGRSYSHPFGLMRVARMTADGVSAKVKGLRGAARPGSAADWFRANYGDSLANEVAIPLTEAWSGAAAEDLSPAVGDGISSGIGRTLWLRAASQVTGRAVACGYSRELPEKASVYHVYPEGGIGALCQKLAEGLDDVIQLDSPVEKILVEREKAVGVRVAGRVVEAAAVISTAPVHVLGKIVEGSDTLSHLSRFRYRPMVFVNLRFKGRGLLPDVVTWTPEGEFPFFRLTETPLSMPWLAPEGKTIITVDIGCEKGDTFWQMDDDALGELCIDNLKRIIPDARDRYLGCRVMRTPIAYPVFMREYEADRQNLANGTGIENLYSVGRNGEFSHIFMEDVHCRTQRKMDTLVRSLTVPVPGARVAGAFLGDVDRNPVAIAPGADAGRLEPVRRPSYAFGALALWLIATAMVYIVQHPEISQTFRLVSSLALGTAIGIGFVYAMRSAKGFTSM